MVGPDEALQATLDASTATNLPPIAVSVNQGKLFDLVFIDADKSNNPEYLRWAVEFSRPGRTMIIVDNIVQGGAVANPADQTPHAVGSRAAVELISSDPRLDGTAIQTVGTKGYDGFLIDLVRE